MDRGYDRHRGRDGESSRRSRSRSPRRERRRDSPERSRRSRSPVPKRDRDDRRSRSPRRDSDRHTRKHSRSRSRDRGRRRRSRSASSSSSSEDSDVERRKKKKRRREKDRDRSRSGSRERRKEKRRLKKEKKERKRQKKNATAATGGEWGKYGIISETDIYSKDAEFRAWLVEERMLNPETLPKDKTRKEFLRFVEDFNTATLPHEKFYHIEAYERRMNAMRSGDTLPPTDGGYDFEADIKAHKSTHKVPDKERESYLSREQLQELRRVQNERIEAGRMKRLGMEVKQNMGVRMDTAFE